MSSLEEKKQALLQSKKYHDENSEEIRFDPNVSKTVIFPADWNKHLSYKDREYDDQNNPGQKRLVTYTVYKVWNPNAQDTKKLRSLSATSALNDEISNFLGMSLEQDWVGATIAKITKNQKGNSKSVKWSVQGDRCSDDKLRELRIIEGGETGNQ